jgi:hypothetical protein
MDGELGMVMHEQSMSSRKRFDGCESSFALWACHTRFGYIGAWTMRMLRVLIRTKYELIIELIAQMETNLQDESSNLN